MTRCMMAAASVALLAACGGDKDDAAPPQPTNTAVVAPTNTPLIAPTNTAPPGATATPTATVDAAPTATQPAGPTHTPGETNGEVQSIESVLGAVIPAAISLGSAGSGDEGGTGAGPFPIDIPPITTPCPNGGTIRTACTAGANAVYDLLFSQCRTIVPGESDTLIDGTLVQTVSGSCIMPNFIGSEVVVEFDGSTDLTDLTTGQTIDVTQSITMSLLLGADGGVQFSIDGSASSSCFGSVILETRETIVVPSGATCPTAGLLYMDVGTEEALIRYTAGGGVEVDLAADGSVDITYPSCEIDVPPCG